MKNLSVFETKEKIKREKDFKIIDVRENWEHEIGVIEHSIKMPLSRLVEDYKSLNQSTEYGVICHSGVRSLQGGSFLQSKGFKVFNVEGGIDKWSLEIDSSIDRY
jgi:rhodanese-related sulfurtransferase